MELSKKPAPPKKQAPPPRNFSKEAIAEDTEREMTGRPQRFGAAAPDEEGSPQEEAKESPGQEQAEQVAGGPNAPGGLGPEGVDQGPVDPEMAQSPEEAEQSAAQHGAEPIVAKHHGHLAKLHQRLKALEAGQGKGGQPPHPQAPPMSDIDDEGRL